MKKKRERRIAMLLAIMMLIMNLIVSPVWAGPGDITINATNFPDKNFRDYVSTKLDTDHNGSLDGTEITKATSIYVPKQNIADLTGIEYFTALQRLECPENQLTSLDVSKNTALQELECSKNQLTSLDISKNTALQELYCDTNKLTNLDISKNTALEHLYCGTNQLTSLDVSKNTALKYLYCSRNQLKGLDVSKNTALEELDCSQNQLTSLDVSKNTALQTLDCDINQLTDLDVSKNPALLELSCFDNKLTKLDVSKNTALQKLDCTSNQLTKLDVSSNTALQTLYCSENQLTSLDVSNKPALQELACDANKLTKLDVSNSPALEELLCVENQLTSLDVSNKPALKLLYCKDNKLTKLDVSNSPALQEIDCSKNQLTSLDVSNRPALQKLYCWENQLTNLDVSKNPALQELECGLNQLTKLDVSNSPALKKLYCGTNQLSTLDISKNTALENLDCQNNKLTKLDVSKNSALQGLYCSDNQLTNLDLSNNPAIDHLHCSRNQLTKLDVSNKSALKELLCEGNQLTSLDLSNNTQILNFDGDNQTYDVKVKTSDMKIPYADFPVTFDITKAKNIAGADPNFIVDATKPSKVTYNYNTGLTGKNINVTLNITYDAYTVTFNTNGGSAVAAQTITAGEHVTKPADPTKDGYTFAGWYKDAGLTTPFDFANETINADTTIYAKWTQNPPVPPTSYTVTFNTNGGTAINPQTITAGEHVTKPADPTKDGYTFAGWYKDAGLTTPFDFATETINADTTIYAKWTQNPPVPPTSYTVTFNTNGGTVINPQTITAGGHVTKPTDPTKDGYTFDGWYKDAEFTTPYDFANETINADTTIYAKWTQNAQASYTLTVNVEGGHGSVTPASATVEKGKPVEVTFKPETNYEIDTVTLDGADVKSQVASNKLTVTMDKSKTLTVKFKLKSVIPEQAVLTVNVEGGHGSVTPASATVEKGKPVEVTFKPETNYEIDTVTLDGADVKSQVASNKLTVTMDKSKTLTVKFKLKSVIPEQAVLTVNVEGGHGSVTPASATVEKGKPVEVTFKPETNYEIDTVTLDGADVKSQVASNKLTVTMDKSKTLTVKFKLKTITPSTDHDVNINPTGAGTITASPTKAKKGETVTLTITPASGYEVDKIDVRDTDANEVAVTGNQFIMPDKLVYVTVTFKPAGTPTQYTLTATVDGGHGSVTPTNATKNKNETVTLTFAPETGYEIEEVKVNDVATPVSGNTLTLTMDGDKTVVVKYKSTPTPPIGTPVTITFDKNGGSGTMADVTKNKGESFTLPACGFIPPAGKEFKAWQVDGTEKNVGDNIVLNGDKIIKAVWKDKGSVPPTPPVPPTPYIPGPTPYPYPYPWTRYPGYWYNIETPKPKEEKPVTKMEMDWKIELAIGIGTIDRDINGVDSKIKMDVAPYIRDGRTMLPLRYVAEALGFDVEWIKSTRTVVLKNSNTRVEIPVDTNKIIVNGTVYTSDVKPEIKNNRTMLPIANIARALGLKDGKDIIWNSKSKMVTIYRSIVVK